jgi:hypothetical protein
MRRAAGPLLVVMLSAMAVIGCTEADLEKIPPEVVERDDSLTVDGQLCTRKPETLVFPLRVLFVVDSSVSMEVTDPPDPMTGVTGRQRAVRRTWERLLERNAEGVRVGVMRFSADAQSKTTVDEDDDGVADTFFTADRTKLDQATASLSTTDRTTNYVNALGEAYFEIRTELKRAKLESLPLSKYSVIFISDGTPDVSTDSPRGGSRQQILESVEALEDLTESFGVDDFSMHTAYISSGRSSFDEQAQSLLREMSQRGSGNFRSFPSGEELNFLFTDLSILRRAFTLKSLSAVNLQALGDRNQVPEPVEVLPEAGMADGGIADVLGDVLDAATGDVEVEPDTADRGDIEPRTRLPRPNPLTWVDLNGSSTIECGEPMVDSDGDGLADLTERKIGTDITAADTDGDALSDGLEWELTESGLDPLVPTDSQCFSADRCEDENDDGECDCLSDTDDDGVCDCVEPSTSACVDDQGHDCVDEDDDGWCDCPDEDGDGVCDFPDSDGDGLLDCEEVFYGTAQNGSDTDADGLPDRTEVRFQTNPAKVDLQDNLDADQAVNQTEVLANTNPRCDDSAFRSRVAYRYQLRSEGVSEGRSCYDFEIDNMTLVPTLQNEEARYPGNGWNRILVYAGEVAFDEPKSFASYRVACVMARYHPDGNYKDPPSGRVSLSGQDFVEVRDFEPDKHCKWP